MIRSEVQKVDRYIYTYIYQHIIVTAELAVRPDLMKRCPLSVGLVKPVKITRMKRGKTPQDVQANISSVSRI